MFGFYYDTAVHNRAKRAAVRRLFQQIKDGVFEGYVSGLVRVELQRTPRPYGARFLGLIDRYALKGIVYDEEEAAVELT